MERFLFEKRKAANLKSKGSLIEQIETYCNGTELIGLK
jgi:hypothetical protein